MKDILGVPTAPQNSFGGGCNHPFTPPFDVYGLQPIFIDELLKDAYVLVLYKFPHKKIFGFFYYR